MLPVCRRRRVRTRTARNSRCRCRFCTQHLPLARTPTLNTSQHEHFSHNIDLHINLFLTSTPTRPNIRYAPIQGPALFDPQSMFCILDAGAAFSRQRMYLLGMSTSARTLRLCAPIFHYVRVLCGHPSPFILQYKPIACMQVSSARPTGATTASLIERLMACVPAWDRVLVAQLVTNLRSKVRHDSPECAPLWMAQTFQYKYALSHIFKANLHRIPFT